MKLISKIVFSVYMFLLLWLILFKTSYDIISVITSVNIREINIIPFVGSVSGMVENFIAFIPLGLFFGMYSTKYTFRQKLFFIFAFSLTLETIQYVLAIGMSDINDVITNTLGGLFGLSLYAAGKKYGNTKQMDVIIVTVVGLAALLVALLRLFVFRVNY
jgi:glycopeptide antibiotics resistance protein